MLGGGAPPPYHQQHRDAPAGRSVSTFNWKRGIPLPVFTGIVEETGLVELITRSPKRIGLAVRCRICSHGTKLGDSIAVNGCCLTVTERSRNKRGAILHFDLLRETWERTNFRDLTTGAAVNLERSLKVGDRMSGHFVTGHIDGTGTVKRWTRHGGDWELEIAAPRSILRYLAFKSSVAIDGVSLTVGKIGRAGFVVWIIPHTCEATALRDRQLGDRVNLEADLLAKYVERLAKL